MENETSRRHTLQSVSTPLQHPLLFFVVGLLGGGRRELSLMGDRNPVWSVGLFRFLSLRVRGDDRRYYVNVQTESLDPIELWQHRLFLKSPGEWETVLIPWSDFLRTRNGRITAMFNADAMNRDEVKTVGASLIERKEGPFCLDIAELKVQ